jgi:hypothetical protein
MTGSFIFTIKAIKRLREAAIHTPTFIGCNRVPTNACASSKKKKKLMPNDLQAKLKYEIV